MTVAPLPDCPDCNGTGMVALCGDAREIRSYLDLVFPIEGGE